MTNKRKIINDPVFGFITIPSDLIFDLLQHPYVHRLSRIKQLGLTHYVYPGTQHTRFQHSVGALNLMIEAVKILQEKGIEITPAEADGVFAAILLHDIGHGPFSHTLEKCFFPHNSHEEVGLAIIERLNKEFQGKLDITLQILKDTYPKHFLHELVSGQLDMDRLDYLRRDSFFSGVSEGNIGSARIIKMLNIKNDKLVVEAKGIYSIENFLMSRRLMYWQVYLHKTAYAVELMLFKTIQRAKYVVQKGGHLPASEALAYFLKNTDLSIDDRSLDYFLDMDDSDIWVALKEWKRHDDKVLSLLSDGIVNRHLFKTLVSKEPLSKEKLAGIQAQIQSKVGITADEASYLMVQKNVVNHMYNGSDPGIDILFSDGSTKSISEASDMFNIDLLSKPVNKFYYAFYRYE